jgi:predicted small secreted protein
VLHWLAREENMTKKLVALIAVTGFVLVAVGCNTVEGAGKDIKASGEAIEKAADKNKPK